MEEKKRIGSLVDFHTRNKLLLMAHSPKYLKQMGNLVAHAKELPKKDFITQYESFSGRPCR